MLPVQGAWVQSRVRELDPACCNSDWECHNYDPAQPYKLKQDKLLQSKRINHIFILKFSFNMCPCAKLLHLCVILCNSMDCSLPGSSVHGILQARILECVAMPSSRGSSRPRDWTCVSCTVGIGRRILCHWATWEALHSPCFVSNLSSWEFLVPDCL